jgi:hypothetical protein
MLYDYNIIRLISQNLWWILNRNYIQYQTSKTFPLFLTLSENAYQGSVSKYTSAIFVFVLVLVPFSARPDEHV